MLDWLQQAITYSLLRVILPGIPIVVLAAQSLVLIPIVVYASASTRSTQTLETARLWFE
jgi:hypothetical protein